MKKLYFPFLLFLTSLIIVTAHSCKKEKQDDTPEETIDQNNPASDSTQMKLTATVDGNPFAADTNSINYNFDADLGLHVFTAPDNSGHIITLMLSSLTPGTYEVDFDNVVIYQNGTTVYTGAFNPQGQIVITKNQNNKISGTYHAELFDFGTAGEVSVTDGHFIHVPY